MGGEEIETMSDSDQIDREWVKSCEDRLRSLPGIDQAAIIIREAAELQSPGTLSVSDLIPDLPYSDKPSETEGRHQIFFRGASGPGWR
jgi:hypothetical protein